MQCVMSCVFCVRAGYSVDPMGNIIRGEDGSYIKRFCNLVVLSL